MHEVLRGGLVLDLFNILLFLPVSLILLVTPGPNVIYVLTRGMLQGRRAAFKGVLGATTGDVVQALAACLGLTALLQTSALAFFIAKALGALYLSYLGIRCFIDRQQLPAVDDKPEADGKSLFFSGFLTSALNPKTALFFLSFLPQFVDGHSVVAVQQQMLFLGLLYSFMGFFVLSAYAVASGRLRVWIAGDERVQLYFNRLTGAIFIAFGLRLAIADR